MITPMLVQGEEDDLSRGSHGSEVSDSSKGSHKSEREEREESDLSKGSHESGSPSSAGTWASVGILLFCYIFPIKA